MKNRIIKILEHFLSKLKHYEYVDYEKEHKLNMLKHEVTVYRKAHKRLYKYENKI
jgi:hypothetical protein